MPQDNSTQLAGAPSLEDVMVALAKQSIFDLPSLVRKAVATAQEVAEEEDSPHGGDVFIHNTYVLWHETDVL